MASHFPCCPVNPEYSWKKTQIGKEGKLSQNFLCQLLSFKVCHDAFIIFLAALQNHMEKKNGTTFFRYIRTWIKPFKINLLNLRSSLFILGFSIKLLIQIYGKTRKLLGSGTTIITLLWNPSSMNYFPNLLFKNLQSDRLPFSLKTI